MKRPRRSALALFLALTPAFATAQRASTNDWAELRRRILIGQETVSLAREYSDPRADKSSTSTLTRLIRSATTRRLGNGRQFLPGFMPVSLAERKQAVAQIACEQSVPPAMALSVIHWESGGSFGPADLRGEAGELGPAQILPSTADQYLLDKDRLTSDWTYNISSGVGIMRSLLERFPEDQAISAYNGGPGYQTSPPEVRAKIRTYTGNVLNVRRSYEGVRCP